MQTKEELLGMVEALAEADPAKQSPYIKLSRSNWEVLGKPVELCGREVIPVSGFPDERIYLTATR